MADPAPFVPEPTVPEAPAVPSAAPSPSPSVPQPPSPKRKRWPLYAGIAAVVAVVLILLLAGAIPGVKLNSNGSSTSTGPIPYSIARSLADGAMASYPGGGWVALVAAGVDSPTSVTIPVNATGTANCSFTPATSFGGSATVPAFTGSLTSGLSPAWEFLFRNASGIIAVVAILNGQATVFGTISGGVCSSLFGLFSAIPTSGIIDSTAVGQAVAKDAQAFLSANTNVTAEYGLTGGVSFLGLSQGPRWAVMFSTCPAGPATSSTATGARFNATVDATTGQVLYNETTQSVQCGTSSGL